LRERKIKKVREIQAGTDNLTSFNANLAPHSQDVIKPDPAPEYYGIEETFYNNLTVAMLVREAEGKELPQKPSKISIALG